MSEYYKLEQLEFYPKEDGTQDIYFKDENGKVKYIAHGCYPISMGNSDNQEEVKIEMNFRIILPSGLNGKE